MNKSYPSPGRGPQSLPHPQIISEPRRQSAAAVAQPLGPWTAFPAADPGPAESPSPSPRATLSLNSWQAWSHFSLFTLPTFGFSSPHPPNACGSFLQQEHPDSPQGCLAPLPKPLGSGLAWLREARESQGHLTTPRLLPRQIGFVGNAGWPLAPPRPRASGGGWTGGQGGGRAKGERFRNVEEIR